MITQQLISFMKTWRGFCLTLLILVIFFSNYPNITGHAIAPLYQQQIDMVFGPEEPCAIALHTNKTITSLRINGEIMGTGLVQIVLRDHRGQAIDVFRNLRLHQNNRAQLITGQMYAGNAIQHSAAQESDAIAIAQTETCYNHTPTAPPQDHETYNGYVRDACENSCDIPPDLLEHGTYSLQIIMEPGMQIRLDTITYTLKQ